MHPVLVQAIARDRHLSMRSEAHAARRTLAAASTRPLLRLGRSNVPRAGRRWVDLALVRPSRWSLDGGAPSTSPLTALSRG